MNYLVIHKNEWDRLQNLANPPKVGSEQEKKAEELNALAEKSREWIKSWPDTDEGHVKQYLKRKEQRRVKEEAAAEKCEKTKKDRDKRRNNEALARARQMIFEDTCYGRKLISALLESKTLEERDAQIKFREEARLNAAELEKQLKAKETRYINFDDEHYEMERKRKQRTIECAQINQEIHQCKKIEVIKLRENEKEMELEDARLMNKLLDYEKEEEKKCQSFAIQALKDEETDHKKAAEHRNKTEKLDKDLADVWCAHLARRRSMVTKVMAEIHKGKQDQELAKKNYELVKMRQDESAARYDDFVNKGINKLEEKENNKLRMEAANAISNRTKLLEQAKENKTHRQVEPVPVDRHKLFCLKQSLFTAGEKNRKHEDICLHQAKPKVRSPPMTLRSQLQERSKDASPWSGTRPAHINFAVNANGVMAECKYKNVVKKVVDDYRKSNNLEPTTLPVSDDEIQPFIFPKKVTFQ